MSNSESKLLSDLDDLSVMMDELVEMDVSNLDNIGWGRIKRFFKKAGKVIKKVGGAALGFCARNPSLCKSGLKFALG